MKYAVICAGGPEADMMDVTSFKKDETIYIGADKGAYYLLERGIVPKEAIGDFDSVTKEEYTIIKKAVMIVDQFQSEKDETDLELAVYRAMAYEPESVIMTGVTGGRIDHTVSALHLMYRMQKAYPHVAFHIRNATNELTVCFPGHYEMKRTKNHPYLSLFAFEGEVTGLTMKGFKYETSNARLAFGTTKFTSNELTKEKCTISFDSGICLMVRSADV